MKSVRTSAGKHQDEDSGTVSESDLACMPDDTNSTYV